MNQTLVIGSAVVDVIVRVEHLPKCGEDVHVSRQSRSLGAVLIWSAISCGISVRLTAFVLLWAAACTGILSMNS